MTGFVVQKVAEDSWPDGEASPYVHWWKEIERDSGVRSLDELKPLPFARRDGRTGFLPLPLDDLSKGRRTMLMWDWALPGGGTGEGSSRLPVPPGGFGDPPPRRPDPRPPAVLVVIDTEINPLHDRFRDGAGRPRILAHWMMEGRFDHGSARVPFGCEHRTDDLEAALAAGRTEEGALRHLGSHSLERPFAPRGTAGLSAHGTQVIDLAAGTDALDRRPEAVALRGVPILAASLPSNRLLSPSGTFLEVFVDQALSWAEARLDALFGAEAWPRVVINLSYGLSAGAKDGLDRGGDVGYLPGRIRALLAERPTARMLMPAGNDGRADLHATLCASDGQREVGWLVMPSDPFSAYAEVWTTGNPAGVGVRLVAPGGGVLAVPDLGTMDLRTALEIVRPADGGDKPMARLYPLGRDADAGRCGVLFCVAPTRRLKRDAAVAPAGTWTIAITGSGNRPLRADVHVQSERPLAPASRVGRPSRLLPSGEVKPRREGTLNAVAVGSGAQIIDALRASDGEAVAWSSQGDRTYVPSFWATGAEVAERSSLRRGLIAAGYRSGTTATVEGTSFACACAARRMVLAALGGGAGPGTPPNP